MGILELESFNDLNQVVDQKLKKRALHRISIIIGQLDALKKAISREDYCIDLLTQSLTIRSALSSMDGVLLENHLRTHVKHMLNNPKQDTTAIQELIRIYDLSNR